jgi:hypothetical protein
LAVAQTEKEKIILAGGLEGQNSTTAFIQRSYHRENRMEWQDGPPLDFGQLWGDIVEDYTLLNLSHLTDTLPALSGITSLLGPCY